MKVIYNKILPLKGYAAMNVFGVILARKECKPLSEKTITHETIHTKQMKPMLYVFFYLWYGIEWIIRLIQYGNTKQAYYNISFEREAYANDSNKDYPNTRKHFGWWKYLYRKGRVSLTPSSEYNQANLK